MLKLRRAIVITTDPLRIRLDGAEESGDTRRAWADENLIGTCEIGDELIVNVEALDLGLGSGGFDIVHVNLTRGLDAPGSRDDHVMKLNYSSLQHPIATIERAADEPRQPPVPVLAISLHGHLAPAAWAAAEAGASGIGYVQTGGGALPGSLSNDVSKLIKNGLLAGHITAGPAYGGPQEAISLVGAIDAASSLGWQGVIAGPGPGILGSATAFGHGGMAALDVIHAGLALGAPVLLAPRLSGGDPRPRHQGLSHHTRSVLDLALGPVGLPMPLEYTELAPEGGDGMIPTEVDLDGYGSSGLPRRTMGRDLDEDRAFFAGPLAAGRCLADLV